MRPKFVDKLLDKIISRLILFRHKHFFKNAFSNMVPMDQGLTDKDIFIKTSEEVFPHMFGKNDRSKLN